MVNRLLRDDPSKGDMNNRQAVGPKLLWKAIQDWEQWPLYIVGLTTYIPPSPPQNYLSLILRQLGFSVFQANLLVIIMASASTSISRQEVSSSCKIT